MHVVAHDGNPVMRAFDAYMTARKYGAELEFIQAFSELQWGGGVCAGTDRGLEQMIRTANMPKFSWAEVRGIVGNAEVEAKWRALTDRNKQIVYKSGLWGVPCISVQAIEKDGTFNGHIDRDMDLDYGKPAVADKVTSAEDAASGDIAFVWGQDKIWQIEEHLVKAQEARRRRKV
jgi:2-hydroxychromene-2-carboxylate isomerase